MKKYLIILLPLLFFIGCEEDNSDDDSSSGNSSVLFDGTWKMTFSGDYENADCSGSVDSIAWGFISEVWTQELTVNGDTYTMLETITGEVDTTYSGTFTEENGNPCLDGECLVVTWIVDGQKLSIDEISDAKCNDEEDVILPEYTDQTSCEDAGQIWDEPICTLSTWEKQ